MDKFSVIVTLLTFWIDTSSGQHLHQHRRFDYDGPSAMISEYYGNSYYENIRPLAVGRDSDVIVGQQTSKGISKLLFECTANFPIQWIYTGDGVPEISTDTNIKRNQINSITPGEFTASLTIMKLTEGHSGNYTCRGTQNRDSLTSFYLFVPGEKIFTSGGNENITFSNRDSLVRIPCSVSHPGAKVNLQKARNGYVDCPLNDSLAYSPKTGFFLRTRDFRDASGTYICTAFFNNLVRVIQFSLIGRYENIQDSICSPSPCGYNAECHVNSQRRTICTCRSGYSGDPFTECRRSGNDPCNPSPCGRYGDCVIRNNLASCTCRPNYIGKPPHCAPAAPGQTSSSSIRCRQDSECDPSYVCLDQRCTSQCDKRCGHRSQCRIVNRTPICSCPAGHNGDPYQECIPSDESSLTSPYEQLEERLRPECQLDLECPDSAACIHQKCQSPCIPGTCGHHHHQLGSCQVRNHKPVCLSGGGHCPPGDFHCNRFGEISPGDMSPSFGGCHRMSCGPHSICQDYAGRGVCRCMEGHAGSPPNCAKMCFGNSGCTSTQVCVGRKCQDPCEGYNSCGLNSRCIVVNRKAECQCINGHVGDPKVRCTLVPATLLQPLCQLRCGPGTRCQFVDNQPTCKCLNPYDPSCRDRDDHNPNTRESVDEGQEGQSCFNDPDCPTYRGCFNGQCKNPCLFFKTLCGQNQECQAIDHKAECQCKKGFPHRINNDCYRHEFGKERNFDTVSKEDDERAIHCEPPFCRIADGGRENNICRFDGDCPSTKKCLHNQCIDMCFCGIDAVCTVDGINRIPRCSCPLGFFGSPKIRCFPLFRQLKNGEGSSASGDGGGGKEIILLKSNNKNKNNSTSGGSNDESSSEEKFGGVLAKTIIADVKNQNGTRSDNNSSG